MPVFRIFDVLKVLSMDMLVRGVLYHYRAAIDTRRALGQRGLEGLGAVLNPPKGPSPFPDQSADFSGPGAIQALEEAGPGQFLLRGQHATMQIRVLGPRLFELRLRQDRRFEPPFSYAIHALPEPVAGASAGMESDIALIRQGDYSLSFDLADGAAALSAEHQTLLSGIRGEVGPEGGLSLKLNMPQGAPWYGLGEKAFDLDFTGLSLELHNTDPAGYSRGKDPIYGGVPFLLTLVNGQAVGLLMDNPYRTRVDFGVTTPGEVHYRASGGELRCYLMAGTPAEVLRQFSDLTGRTQMPPLWSLGFHISRWSYYPQARVMEIAEGFRSRKLPCDAIHLDIHYMDGYRCFTVDKERFPDFRGMHDQLHAQGFKTITIIDPGIKVDQGYRVYDEGLRDDHFIAYPDGTPFSGPVWPGDCHFPDFSRPATRAWWGDQYRPLLEAGVDSFWNDMNEIALITSTIGSHVPEIVRHDKEGLGADHAEIKNQYGLLMIRASMEGLQRLRPERRPWVMSRATYAGLQRYGTHWLGDNNATWDDMRLSIAMTMNLGLCGIPITGPDVGGFAGTPTPELYTRWMQAACLLPFYRVHTMQGTPDQEPWALGEDTEAISRRYLELRYRLLPAIYTAIFQSHVSGAPVARPLFWDFWQDQETQRIQDQYMLGDALMAAPVMEEGATSRGLYLPQGLWYDWWTGQRLEGGRRIHVEAPLEELPLFVRAGAVIPMWPVQQYVGEKAIDVLSLRAYPGAASRESWLYEDDGETPDYASHAKHRLSRFTLTEQGLSRSVEGGYEPEYKRVEIEVIAGTGEPRRFTVEHSGPFTLNF